MTPPAHRVTTAHLGAAYPFICEGGLGADGALIGEDLLGGWFVYDPFELYARGILTNPNMVVLGQIGRGKSAFVKSYLWRQAAFGRRAWVVDPKGEYSSLASAWGTEPIRLRPGGPIRLNPLDTGPAEADCRRPDVTQTESGRRQTELLGSLAGACLGRPVTPRERAAVELALASAVSRSSQPPTLPAIISALLDPSAQAAAIIRTDRATLAEDGRDVALELRRLVEGDLRGMFDGPTTPGIDLDGSLVVLDLSALYRSAALGILMTCATAWLQAALARGDGHRRIVVIDEAWAILANLGVARWLQASWKLSRAYGVANVAVLHRLSDLGSVGAAGSEQVGLAQGLLSDSETRVIYGQSPGEAEASRQLLGLTTTEADLLSQLSRGVALWKVGRRSFLVRHRLGPSERALVDTDAAMAARPAVPPGPLSTGLR